MTRSKKPIIKKFSQFYILYIALIIAIVVVAPQIKEGGITGLVILEETEIKNEFEYQEQDNITRSSAFVALLDSEDVLAELSSNNLSVLFIQDELLQAKRYFIGKDPIIINQELEKEENKFKTDYLDSLLIFYKETPGHEIKNLDYSEVMRSTQLIEFRKNQAYDILDTISLLEDKEKEYSQRGIDTQEPLEFLEESKVSFKEERYDEAQAYLKEADLKLDQASFEHTRIRGILRLSKNFFIKYWYYLLIILSVLVIAVKPVAKKIRKHKAKNKLEKIRLEQITLKKLLKQAQEKCFKFQTMTKDTYDAVEDKYKTRSNEIKRQIPVLESIISGKKIEKKKEEKQGILKI